MRDALRQTANTHRKSPNTPVETPTTIPALKRRAIVGMSLRDPCPFNFPKALPFALIAWLALVPTGCSTVPPDLGGSRRFHFEEDTFAYANQLVWKYHFDERSKWTSRPREPKPDYTHHCFVVARAAKQFFAHARFDPALPVADGETYRHLIRRVVSQSPHRTATESERIVIPGYANLREFSAAQEGLLKGECGGAWQSYFQHGHWRMIWPFTRAHQERTAEGLVADLERNQPPVIHVVRFPSLTINHAVLLFDCSQTPTEIRFAAYDPNSPEQPVTLTYHRDTRTFSLPTNFYFPGGRVDVYQIYRNWCY
jgi:hypothetical protein